VEFFEGCRAVGKGPVRWLVSADQVWTLETQRTLAGSGLQYTRGLCAEQAVEVVRNHEDGT